MKNLYQECLDLIISLADHDTLYFDQAVEIRHSPHSFPFLAWGVCASPGGAIYVMDSDGQWHELKTTDINAMLVIGSLYQRLMFMRNQYAKAS